VLNVVKYFGNIQPHQIKDRYFDHKALAEIRKEYEEGKFTLKDIDKSQFFYEYPEVKKRLEKKSVSIRTINRKLAELTGEGLVENDGKGTYSLSAQAKSTIKYFAYEFGETSLNSLMGMFHINSRTTFKESISKLVTIFGIFIVYCFMEASRPLSNTDLRIRDSLASSCVKNMVSLENMYDYFLSIVWLYTRGQRQEIDFLKSHLKNDGNAEASV
jgi:hypothetical protein